MSINTTLIAGHKIIVDPENTHDVSRVLGMNSLDVGVLCSDGNGGTSSQQESHYINKWAKYKPVKNSANNYTSQLVGGTGTNKNKWSSSATWWKAADGKCGLIVSTDTTGANLIAHWDSNWLYDAITVNSTTHIASHWCRLTDFNYYDHNANAPLTIGYPTQYQINQQQTLDIVFQAHNGSDYSLMLTDFTNPIWGSSASMYCGVLVVWGTPNIAYNRKQKISVVNSTPLGTNLTNYGKYTRVVSIPYSYMPTLTPNEIQIYPFLCQNAYALQSKGADQDVAWEYGVLPCPCEPATIEAVMGYITGVISGVTCTYGSGGNSVQLAFTYTVTGHGGGFSKNNIYAMVYVLDNDTDTQGQYPDYEKKNGHHIISYGSATNNPCQGQFFASLSVADNASQSFTQETLMNDVTGNLTIGIDAASYVADYRSRHGSGAAKITLIIEFVGDDNGIYGQATLSDISIGGSY